MRNIVAIVVAGFFFYWLTPGAQGANFYKDVSLWEGKNVTGLVCMSILDKETKFPTEAEYWVVAGDLPSEKKTGSGVSCVEVPLSQRSVVRVALPNENTEVKVIKDYTTPYFAVVIPH